MANGFRPNLGLTLQDTLARAQSSPQQGTFSPPPAATPAAQPEMSKGAMIMGLLGDALSTHFGGQAVIAPMLMRQREQAAEEARWGKRLDAQREANRADRQWEWQNKPAELSPMLRDLAAFQQMSPEQRALYGEMQDTRSGPVTTTLPNGQLYSGPRSGLAAALTGQMQTQPAQPVGKLTPITGGGAGNGVGGFRR